ncbi:sulfonate ABC transporter substrate-binding protein [Scytonema hofmannii PCC 7110]|uniref:Putative aliphatic sulfonates-binding protein n=1 Tax=Scytonema hofmannii PCC 7110 TaxID=128403 RepID=A0A139XAW8_9CYAN|nr:sulfonate ABC transporter substrate-binding protein [Scytonema hofmannii]KYC41829.1 sulfonate ABC transporter substrate-binding protein [Scytonema hofmannii PCC 7110]
MLDQILQILLSQWKALTKLRFQRYDKNKRLFSVFPMPIFGAFLAGLCLSLLFAACSANNSADTSNPTVTSVANSGSTKASVIRFGYQKSAILIKSKGVLEKRLQPEGVSVEWIEFPAGPQLLEALNVGSIDFGHTGESPPIFAQAAGAALTYIAGIAASPQGSAILIPQNSPIKTLADLKGKKIAFQKGSSAHYMLLQLLEQAKLQYSDIQPVYLPPADARAAFVKGSIDAWSIWDPFYASAEKNANARVLIDGTNINKQGGYYLASRKFANENQETIKAVLEEIQKLEAWSDKNREAVAETLSPVLGIDLDTLKKATNRKRFGVVPITDDLIATQQQVADTFYNLKLIPKKIDVKEAMLKPEEYASLSPKI